MTVDPTPERELVSPAEVPLLTTHAPLHTEKTIRRGTSDPLQGYRFAAVSLCMLNMIRKSHH
jgi:hypothetical protein